ncbi:MAG: transcriptional regulator [Acidobacteria bacterium]|nr:transcriptional regulator [Acidobacteriota bacterium]
MPAPTRYRFGPFLVSPRQRALLCDGREVPLIPRYFDLLVLLVARRDEAVHRNDIFATVWSDVVVSDGALTQAVRALRRALGDDVREPVFIRTISRHGYRFVYEPVVEEPDDGALPRVNHATEPAPGAASGVLDPAVAADSGGPRVEEARGAERQDARDEPQAAVAVSATAPGGPDAAEAEIDRLLDRLCAESVQDEERRECAERLHGFGLARVLERLDVRPNATLARAVLRDTRWDVAGAGDVPLGRGLTALRTAGALVALRARRAWRLAGDRWLAGLVGAGVAGAVVGAAGGLALAVAPDANAPPAAAAVLGLIGAAAGAWGAAGVGAGIAGAEVLARSARGVAVLACAAAGGAVVSALGGQLLRWTLEALFGLRLAPLAGALEGLVLGAAIGGAYAWGTRGLAGGGMAAPRGRARLGLAGTVAAAGAFAALALVTAGQPMVGGMVHEVARASRQSSLSLAPLARVVGEPDVGPVTGALIGVVEGAAFGFGLVVGLARRPRPLGVRS